MRATLHGAIRGEVAWASDELDCDGMPRPDGAGARLHFAGHTDGHRLAVIIAMPGLARGIAAQELASNVTMIEEGSGRFFSTPGLESCWTDVESQSPAGDEDAFAVKGTLYCIAPLPEVNGDASVSVSDLEFSGRLDWGAQ